jgi:hypothetical protein
MVSVLSSSVVDSGFEPRSGQIKDYKICICCISAKHAALRRKNKDCLARKQENVSGWGRHVYQLTVISVSYHYKNPTKLIMLGYAPLITCASTDKRNPHSHKSVSLNQISSAEFGGFIIFTLFE